MSGSIGIAELYFCTMPTQEKSAVITLSPLGSTNEGSIIHTLTQQQHLQDSNRLYQYKQVFDLDRYVEKEYRILLQKCLNGLLDLGFVERLAKRNAFLGCLGPYLVTLLMGLKPCQGREVTFPEM